MNWLELVRIGKRRHLTFSHTDTAYSVVLSYMVIGVTEREVGTVHAIRTSSTDPRTHGSSTGRHVEKKRLLHTQSGYKYVARFTMPYMCRRVLGSGCTSSAFIIRVYRYITTSV